MPELSSSPPLPRGEGGEGCGGCGDRDCSLPRSATEQQQRIQNGSSKGREEVGDGSSVDDRPRNLDDDLNLDLLRLLARFVLAELPARWRSRQRVSGLGLALADLLPEVEIVGEGSGVAAAAAAEEFPPDCGSDEGEGEAGGDGKGPTLALLAFRGDGSGNDANESLLLSHLGAIEAAAPNFQVLAACRDEKGAAELASRLESSGGSGDGGGGGGGDRRRRCWSWRPLSRGGGAAGSFLLVVQLFSRSDDSSASSSSSLLVASDYDHTLVDDNSDPLVVEALGASEALRTLWRESKNSKDISFGWTEAVDAALRAGAAATARLGERDPEEVVLASAASAPCSAALRRALLSVCGKGKKKGTKKESRNDFAILSDANDVFIAAGLRGNGLLGLGDEEEGEEEEEELNLVAVATNAGAFVDVPVALANDGESRTPAHRRLALSRASERYHGLSNSSCPQQLCPANLCKGRLLARLLVAGPGAPYSRGCLYLGDGANDVCPAASCLGPLDAALARERYGKEGNQAAFGAAVLLPSPPSSPSCPSAPSSCPSGEPKKKQKKTKLLCRSVVPWSTQEELAEALLREVAERSGG